MSRATLPPRIKVHLPTDSKFAPPVVGAYSPTGWMVCTGNTRKPAHGCLWSAVGFYKTVDAAMRHYAKLESEPEGRALIDCSNPRLYIVTWKGAIWRSIEATEKLLA